MPRTVTQNKKPPNIGEYENAITRWERCKPPYTSSHIQICVTAAKTILAYDGKPRRSKYEKENYLRIDFSKAGKVTFYAEFPKKLGLKGRKLGNWPELQIAIAREKAHDIAADGLRAESVHQAIDMYESDLSAKVERKRLSEASFYTYKCRINHLRLAFDERQVFADATYNQLLAIIDNWIATKSNNYALELFAELRRMWRFCAPLLAGGKNIAASIPDDYVSSRVQRPMPTRLYTDIESIAALWLNVASCTSVHQKNAIRYMIITGVRPINVCNLRWDWVNDELTEITYPAAVIGMRGAMKTQTEFRLPVTPSVRRILEEQLKWRDAAPQCNREFVFLQPRNPSKAFSKRALDKLIKTHTPEGAIKGVMHEGTIKGSNGAFNTMCRKFLKTNVITQLRVKGFSRSEVKEISQLCMHHSDGKADPMAEYYDFSDEILQEEIALKRLAFEAHEASILQRVALIRKKAG